MFLVHNSELRVARELLRTAIEGAEVIVSEYIPARNTHSTTHVAMVS